MRKHRSNMNKLLDNKDKVEFYIGTLLLLEKELNCPLDVLLFEMEITEEIQELVICYGYRNYLEKSEVLELYRNLSANDRLSIDLIVNGRLLDAFGVGKQQESESLEDNSEPKKLRFFSEYINEFKNFMVGVVGLSKHDFYNSTPIEVFDFAESYRKGLENVFALNQYSHINAIGLTSSKKFKAINPFEKENKGYKKVDIDKKKRDLEFLKKVGE